MSAKVHYTTHTAVIDDNTEETGTVILRKIRAGEVEAKLDFTQPDVKSITFEQRQAQIYYPKIKTVQVYDLGKYGEQVDRFLMLGFGTSGTELAHDYDMKVSDPETIGQVQAVRLEMMPKTEELKKVVSKIELWVPAAGAPYPLREKVYEKSPGDYRIANYTDIRINPSLSSDALKLKLPSKVKVEHPQK